MSCYKFDSSILTFDNVYYTFDFECTPENFELISVYSNFKTLEQNISDFKSILLRNSPINSYINDISNFKNTIEILSLFTDHIAKFSDFKKIIIK